jgi:hypothetical protein
MLPLIEQHRQELNSYASDMTYASLSSSAPARAMISTPHQATSTFWSLFAAMA